MSWYEKEHIQNLNPGHPDILRTIVLPVRHLVDDEYYEAAKATVRVMVYWDVKPRVTTQHETVTGAWNVSISGETFLQRRGNHRWLDDHGGQCEDRILQLYPNSTRVKRLVELWDRWHLNDMKAGCAHQGELWTCTNHPDQYLPQVDELRAKIADARREPATEENVAHLQALGRDLATWTDKASKAHFQQVANGWPVVESLRSQGSDRKTYLTVEGLNVAIESWRLSGSSCVVCGRNRWDEPSDKCPVSGYRYGTAHLHEVVPMDVYEKLKTI